MKALLLFLLAAACPVARGGDAQAVPLTAGPSPNYIPSHVMHPPIPAPALPVFAGNKITCDGGTWNRLHLFS